MQVVCRNAEATTPACRLGDFDSLTGTKTFECTRGEAHIARAKLSLELVRRSMSGVASNSSMLHAAAICKFSHAGVLVACLLALLSCEHCLQ